MLFGMSLACQVAAIKSGSDGMTQRQKLLIAVVIIILANVWLWSSNKTLLQEMEKAPNVEAVSDARD